MVESGAMIDRDGAGVVRARAVRLPRRAQGQQRPRLVQREQGALRGRPARARARLHRGLRALPAPDQPAPAGRRPARRRLAVPHLPRHALLEGQDALQDHGRHLVQARAGQGRPRARPLPAPGAGRRVRRRRHLASRHARPLTQDPRRDRRRPRRLARRPRAGIELGSGSRSSASRPATTRTTRWPRTSSARTSPPSSG